MINNNCILLDGDEMVFESTVCAQSQPIYQAKSS
jgi:hypothetical protein